MSLLRLLAPALVAGLLLLPLVPAGADVSTTSVFVPKGATLTVAFHPGGHDLLVTPASSPRDAPTFSIPARSCTLVGETGYLSTFIGDGLETCDLFWSGSTPLSMSIAMAGVPGFWADVYVENEDGSWFAVQCTTFGTGSDGGWGLVSGGATCYTSQYGRDPLDYTSWVAGIDSQGLGVVRGAVSP
jgi:hypothetical protein